MRGRSSGVQEFKQFKEFKEFKENPRLPARETPPSQGVPKSCSCSQKWGWGGFDFADRVQSDFVPRIRILSRRDYRTQPGVLTPGTDKQGGPIVNVSGVETPGSVL